MSTYWIATEATSRDNTTTLQMRDNTTIITALATVISFLLGLGAVTLIVVCILVYRKKTLVFNQQRYRKVVKSIVYRFLSNFVPCKQTRLSIGR